jgi:hypothetical protein
VYTEALANKQTIVKKYSGIDLTSSDLGKEATDSSSTTATTTTTSTSEAATTASTTVEKTAATETTVGDASKVKEHTTTITQGKGTNS